MPYLAASSNALERSDSASCSLSVLSAFASRAWIRLIMFSLIGFTFQVVQGGGSALVLVLLYYHRLSSSRRFVRPVELNHQEPQVRFGRERVRLAAGS